MHDGFGGQRMVESGVGSAVFSRYSCEGSASGRGCEGWYG